MEKSEYRVYRDTLRDGWYYEYTDCQQAEPRGPYADQYDADHAAMADPGPSPSDYLL